MPNYPTSPRKPSLKRRTRYFIHYEDDIYKRTFGALAYTPSEASARVILYIKQSDFQVWGEHYYLTIETSAHTADIDLDKND